MFEETIFMIEIYPDMYHDTVSISVSYRFVLRSVFLRLHTSRVAQRTLESTQLSLLVSTLLLVLSTRLEIWNSRGMCKDLSRGMKVNEFADLTTSEFVSENPEENPNIVWSGRKHLETMKVLDSTPTVLSLGKLCDENGYSYDWINGQKPHLIKKRDSDTLQYGELRSYCGSKLIKFVLWIFIIHHSSTSSSASSSSPAATDVTSLQCKCQIRLMID